MLKLAVLAPPNRLTLHITLMWQLFPRKVKALFYLPSADFLFVPHQVAKIHPQKKFACTRAEMFFVCEFL
jgi:hypothetical protein